MPPAEVFDAASLRQALRQLFDPSGHKGIVGLHGEPHVGLLPVAERLAKLEDEMRQRDHAIAQQFQQVFALLYQLFNPPSPPRTRIGFHTQG